MLGQHLVAGYITLAVLMVLLALPFVFFTPDYPLAPADRQPFSWHRVAASYWLNPRQYPDFGWAWLTRFLASLAIAMGTLYLLYFLRDAVHYARLFPGQTAADGLLILILIYTGCVVLASIVGGIISDRRGRRKMMVTLSGLLMAAAALLLAFWETWPAAMAAALLYGFGYGAYIAVNQALITQVLPKARDRAKDLGIINIAIVCPGAIGAVIAAPLVSLAGYPALFGATAVVAIAASIGVWQIEERPLTRPGGPACPVARLTSAISSSMQGSKSNSGSRSHLLGTLSTRVRMAQAMVRVSNSAKSPAACPRRRISCSGRSVCSIRLGRPRTAAHPPGCAR